MTKTRVFGSSSRESHDSSAFYGRQIYASTTTTCPESTQYSLCRNKLFHRSSERMDELLDNSVALMITSPPYNVGKSYDDNYTMDDYLALLRRVFEETYRVLEPGGRACINIANIGRKPYIPLSHYIASILNNLGFLMRGEIIWKKASGANGSCAWGSFKSASNPTLRDTHEYILVFSKGQFQRAVKGTSTILRDAFLRDTLSIWEFPPASATRIGHPAPFPLELPARLIELYSFAGDLILDPFMGSGTTCVAAKLASRDYIGYEIVPAYIDLTTKRLDSVQGTQGPV